MTKPVYHLGIDVRTSDLNKLAGRLKRLGTTRLVEFGKTYKEDPAWSLLNLDTTMDLEDLDDWLWRRSGVDYAGTFERSTA